MNLKINNKYFIVGGAGSGFGRAIALALANDGANILAVSRTEEKLITLQSSYPKNIEYLCGDIMLPDTQKRIFNWAEKNKISGVVFNASGPPAGGSKDVDMQMWDDAWQTVVRWKIALCNLLLPVFKKQQYGRLLFIESVSVKQPVKNLILSNALRPAIVGFAKTLSQEIANEGITINILAPGYHRTAAMERLFVKKAEFDGISVEEAQLAFENEIPVGEMGKPEEMASIALWLLSPLSRYVTGQTITHDGGLVNSFFG
ncbi:MAG: SDR family oxidoreductase [Bacteroidota bacterium]